MATVETDSVSGPASYAAGGFTVTTGLSTVDFFSVRLTTTIGANLPVGHFEITRNSPAAGQVTVKVLDHQYDKLTAIGSPSGLPAGVTAPTTSGQTYDTTSHLHSMDHNHAPQASSTPGGGGTGVLGGGLNNHSAHTHNWDLPNFVGNTANETAHVHTWNNLYQHQHSATNTETNMNTPEIAAGTNLSGATFNYLAVKI